MKKDVLLRQKFVLAYLTSAALMLSACDDSTGETTQPGYVYTSSTATNYPSGCTLNSTYYLTSTQLTAGNSSFPAPAGGTETGHTGNGYARISVVTQ